MVRKGQTVEVIRDLGRSCGSVAGAKLAKRLGQCLTRSDRFDGTRSEYGYSGFGPRLLSLFVPVQLWIQALTSGASVGIISLIGMRFRRVHRRSS